jgi:predicted DCC family thiol-disulfide oxidoreductase YuxK
MHSIILFDGVCNLCNWSVQFVIKHDPEKKFQFASLQSDYAKKLLTDYSIDSGEMNSFILLENGKIYTRSTGALRVLKQLKGWSVLFYCFILVPKFIRNGIYDFIAKKRYRWFGKREECMIPSPEINSRFLNE